MYYNISFNPKKIRQISSKTKLTYESVGPILGIDREHFAEKDNWYYVDGAMKYFKEREDTRVLGELLSDEILRLHGFVPASYEVISLGDKIGLLSPNIHREGYRYESVATLHRLFPEFKSSFYSDTRKVTLIKIIDFLKMNVPNSDALIEQIIRKYVIDWFTHQLDFNIRNMTFELNQSNELRLATIIDSEASFGATKRGINSDTKSSIWVPAIPVEDETFKSGPYKIDDLDANIYALLCAYPNETLKILSEFTDQNYDRMIERYRRNEETGLYVDDTTLDFLKSFVESKQKEASEFISEYSGNRK